jgi:hypothetical protein
MKTVKYQPTQWAIDNAITLPGLAGLISTIRGLGGMVYVVDEEGEERWSVTSRSIAQAVAEMDETLIVAELRGKRVATVLVIAGNGEDWLCDYSCHADLQHLFDQLGY